MDCDSGPAMGKGKSRSCSDTGAGPSYQADVVRRERWHECLGSGAEAACGHCKLKRGDERCEAWSRLACRSFPIAGYPNQPKVANLSNGFKTVTAAVSRSNTWQGIKLLLPFRAIHSDVEQATPVAAPV